MRQNESASEMKLFLKSTGKKNPRIVRDLISNELIDWERGSDGYPLVFRKIL